MMNTHALTRRQLLKVGAGAAATSLLPAAYAGRPAPDCDVLVYGATPAGIAAAIAAARRWQNVTLIEPTRRIGGLITNGLTHADFRTFEGLTGAFLDFARRCERHYAQTYGPDSPQVRDSLRGTQIEPKVALATFEQMLAEHPRITVKTSHALSTVRMQADADVRRILAVHLADAGGNAVTISAALFIDASYEGDLMAKAGVPWRVGREGRDEYGESLAPETADDQLQGYNFRLTMTRQEANRAPIPKPLGYRREDYLELLPLLESGKIKRIFDTKPNAIYKAQLPQLPNGKFDINDVSMSIVRLSLPGEQLGWPDGDDRTRQDIFNVHVRHNVGMLYFLQHDEAVPSRFRDEAREWGLCRDEMVDSDHLPLQLYVREARRMVGVHVFTEQDVACAGGDVRAVLHRDAIAMGDYGPNCHGTAHEGPRIGGRHTGEFYKKAPPYQVPYGTLVPREIGNLLVPVAASSSHVGFCALRLEPIWMSLGQAAGTAAGIAIKDGVNVQQVEVAKVQRLLHADGAATVYVSDVLPGHADFAAVQWWAAAGGLHGLIERTGDCGVRGKNVTGQYFEAFPGHTAELEKPLDEATRSRWLDLAAALKLDAASLAQMKTRGEFIRRAFGLKG